MTKLPGDIPRGQLPMIVLSALSGGDKYGLEIISIAEEKTHGEVVIKQPSLYSALKRMEESNQISSYWEDSAIGGKRHYYSITQLGNEKLEEWAALSTQNLELKQSMSMQKTPLQKNVIFESKYLKEASVDVNDVEAVNEELSNSNTILEEGAVSANDKSLSQEDLQQTILPNHTENAPVKDNEIFAESVLNNATVTEQKENIVKQNEVQKDETSKVEAKATDLVPKAIKPVYVQNNIFSNFSQISDPAELVNNANIKPATKKLPPKQYKQPFNIESELNKIITKPKSFSDSVIENKHNYVFAPLNSTSIEIENETIKSEEDFELADNENQNTAQNVVSNTFVQTQHSETIEEKPQSVLRHSSLVTDRIPRQKAFRVQKMAPPIFDIRSPSKFDAHKNTSVDPALLKAIESQNDVDKLEIYFKAKNIAVKKYAKHASRSNSNLRKMNAYLFRAFASAIALLFSGAIFLALVLPLINMFQVSNFELIFSLVAVGVAGFYVLLNLLLTAFKRKKTILIPKQIANKKAVLFSFAISIVAFFSVFLLIFSVNYDISEMLYKMIFVFSTLLLMPFSLLSQFILNKLFSAKTHK